MKTFKNTTLTLTASLLMTCFATAQTSENGTGDDQGSRARAERMVPRHEGGEIKQLPTQDDRQQQSQAQTEESAGKPDDQDGEGQANPRRFEESEESAEGEGQAEARIERRFEESEESAEGEGQAEARNERRFEESEESAEGEGQAEARMSRSFSQGEESAEEMGEAKPRFSGQLQADVFSFEVALPADDDGSMVVLLVARSPELMHYEGEEVLALGTPKAGGQTEGGEWAHDEVVDDRPDRDLWFQAVIIDEDGSLRFSEILRYEAKEEVAGSNEGANDPESGNSEPVAEPFVATWHDDVANHDR